MFKLHSIIPCFKWFFSFLAMFGAGDVLGDLGGGGDGGVITDPFTGATVEEESTAEPAEGEPTAEPGEESAAEPGARPAGKPGPGLARPLSKEAAGAVKGLKESAPKAWKEINGKLYALDAYDKKIAEHFPEGGLDSAVALKDEVDGVLTQTNTPSLGELVKEVDGYRGMDKQILSGDIRFLDEMPPEMIAGIDKMTPQFVSRWAERDKPGYERYFSGLMDATLQQSGVAETLRYAIRDLERMGVEDQDVKSVHDALKQIEGIFANIKKGAQAPAVDPAKKTESTEDPEVAKGKKEIADFKLQQTRSRIAKSVNDSKGSAIVRIIKSVAGDKFSQINPAEVWKKARLEYLYPVLGKSYSDHLDEYITAGDEAGAAKYTIQQLTDQRLTDAITKAYKAIYRSATLGSTPPGKKQTTTTTATRPTTPSGITKIAYNPKYQSIDRAKTESLAKKRGTSYANLVAVDMIAVLKNGKVVKWDENAEAEK